MEIKQINEYIKKCHEASKSNGWSDLPESEPERSEWLADRIDLIASEGAKMVETIRENKYANLKQYSEGIHGERWYLDKESFQLHKKRLFKKHIKDTVPDKLADIFMRTCDMMVFYAIEYQPLKKGKTSNIKTKYLIRVLRIEALIESSNVGKITLYPITFNNILGCCLQIAKNENINLPWFIDAKLEYNQSRDLKHRMEF